MIVQAAGIWVTVLVPAFAAWVVGAALQGLGTAMVYPTLLAAITDYAHPTWRATSLGVYRFWRDLGYAVGALVSGAVADFVGLAAAIHLVAALTFVSGLVVVLAMKGRAPCQSRFGGDGRTSPRRSGLSSCGCHTPGVDVSTGSRATPGLHPG